MEKYRTHRRWFKRPLHEEAGDSPTGGRFLEKMQGLSLAQGYPEGVICGKIYCLNHDYAKHRTF